MGVYSRPAQLAQAMEKRFEGKRVAVEKALEEVATTVQQDLYTLTSGSASQSELNRENNPYGQGSTNPRGRRRPRRPDLPINVQKGDLRRSIFKEKQGRGWSVGFHPDHPYYKFIAGRNDGTRRLKKRGLWREMDRRIKAYALGIKRAFKAAK